ncbi:hypothetical protein DB30_01552 [Enhygromyxa salina]|uniref:DUF2169 domain-containing protein n=1 Tax=Enhygromyxa salina TaxID=215803 RepID=A0A0C2CM83_9BACT|nr:DUF2169 domain-containing protein [Enhygromyxa salina]KIG12361.1 hypothetical protein DB30_01552 [Enhygromyxa salina]
MKVIKPSKLGVLTRGFEHQRKFHMGVSVLAFVPLGSAPSLLPEAAMWPFTGQRLGAEGALDAGIPKARGEFLINGSAYTPGAVPAPTCNVRAQVGPVAKTLRASGERVWLSGRQSSEPSAFTAMRLSWANAYGGPDYAKNPLGKGNGLSVLHGQEVQLLPNIEDPRALVQSARDTPEPAGFGPIDLSWPQRTSLAGTHDQHWLENLFPGFAADIDWSFFNLAPVDQQAEQFWTGGESYEFVNLHPSQPVLRGQLPRWHARVFVRRVTEGFGPGAMARLKLAAKQDDAPPAKPQIQDHELEEVPLRLQTLWFFPDAERAVLIWQGSLQVRTDDCTDISHLLIAADDHEQVRPREHYGTVLRQRLDPEIGPLAALDDSPLLPALADAGPPITAEAMPAREGLLEANLHAKRTREFEAARALVAAHGLDPDIHGPPKPEPPPPPPRPEDMPALAAKAIADAKQQEQELRAEVAEKQAKIGAELDEAGVDGLDSKTLEEELAGTTGPPTFSAKANRAMLEAVTIECRAQGWINDEIEAMLADRELEESWIAAEAQARDAYRSSAHNQPPAPPIPPTPTIEVEATRARLLERVAAGEGIRDLDFTGADLRNMDLRGADLSDGWLESAQLDGSDLSGAKLDEAVLAHASLVGVKLDGATACKANLGKARVTDSSAVGVDFSDAILHAAVFTRTGLQRANLTRADLVGVTLDTVDASELVASELLISEATLSALSLVGAALERCVLVGLELGGADLSLAKLTRCAFVNCDLRKVNFSQAHFNSVAFVETCILTQARFVGAQLPGCNLREMPLDGADFTQANLDRADLSGAALHGAVFYRVSAREARFDKADLGGASLLAANLMGASFMNASICGADLRGANLFGADMARVRSDDGVRLDQALLTKVRIHPKHVQEVP